MRVLAVDIGTNSTLYLVADVRKEVVSIVERGIFGNRLGAEIGIDGFLSDQLIAQNNTILLDINAIGDRYEVESRAAVGTHALRNCKNVGAFLDLCKNVDLPLSILTPLDEAQMTWQGVFGAAGPDSNSVLLDIGGGSSEILVGKGAHPNISDSVPWGAVTLTRQFISHDPPLQHELVKVRTVIETEFAHWKTVSAGSVVPMAVAGTAVTLAGLEYNISDYANGAYEGLMLTQEQVAKWSDLLCGLDYSQRHSLPCMLPARAGSIHIGALFLLQLMQMMDWHEISVSERGLIFGLAGKIGNSGY